MTRKPTTGARPSPRSVAPEAAGTTKVPEGGPATVAVADADADRRSVLDALILVRDALAATDANLRKVAAASGHAPGLDDGEAAAVGAGEVRIWEDDPFSEERPTAKPTSTGTIPFVIGDWPHPNLAVRILTPAPARRPYQAGTDEFRYWNAMSAMARGVEFWSRFIPAGTQWMTATAPMQVSLVGSYPVLNATYSRHEGLSFFRQRVRGVDVYTGESPDIVCHELGHAILDAIRPEIFHVGGFEASAFHEAFGDISAILVGLQLPSVRRKVLTQTKGKLNVNSQLSRVAEQLGWAIRQTDPESVDADALRNAANLFQYRPAASLPASAPSSLLSSESHSMSRVFTGAILDLMAGMFASMNDRTEERLLEVTIDVARLLVDSIMTSRVTWSYFSELASGMMAIDENVFGGRYKPALINAFLKRGLISAISAATLDVEALAAAHPVMEVRSVAGTIEGSTADVEATLFDLPIRDVSIGDLAVAVRTPEWPTWSSARPALYAAAAFSTTHDEKDDADLFVARLFEKGMIVFDDVPDGASSGIRGLSAAMSEIQRQRPDRHTHRVVREDGRFSLVRERFSCGHCAAFEWLAEGVQSS